jgi:hypothetical protein
MRYADAALLTTHGIGQVVKSKSVHCSSVTPGGVCRKELEV